MIPEHGFWWLLTMACVVWYSTITVYVAVKGAVDIRDMLSHLGSGSDNSRARAGKPEKKS
jgi:hypothetical protein